MCVERVFLGDVLKQLKEVVNGAAFVSWGLNSEPSSGLNSVLKFPKKDPRQAQH